MSCNLCSDCPFINSDKIYYEAHITVKPADNESEFQNRFMELCKNLKYKTKGLCIENFHLNSNTFHPEWITCSKYDDSLVGAYNTLGFSKVLDAVSNEFIKHGLTVVRQKIETVPWNHDVIKKSCGYFETHIDLDISHCSRIALDIFLNYSKLLLSRNVGSKKHILTYRKHMNDYDNYMLCLNSKLNRLMDYCEIYNIKLGKQITEYACYDDNQALDDKWIRSYEVGELKCHR